MLFAWYVSPPPPKEIATTDSLPDMLEALKTYFSNSTQAFADADEKDGLS